MMVTHEELAAREAGALLPTYGARARAFVHGEGAYLFDVQGTSYLDFLSGLSVTSLGHAHPAVTEAVTTQAAVLVHTSNLFYTEPQIRLAEELKSTLGWEDGKAFFCNSGAEANEAAMKLARRHGKKQHEDKVEVVALNGGFHGRTLGTLPVTGNPAKHVPFEPLGNWVHHVDFDDAVGLEGAVNDRTCAVVLEVIQGEGGVRPVPGAVLRSAREAADRHGALLVVDEVQTGIGRLGAWYAWQTTEVMPDVICLAKALANGLPVGAIVARGVAAEAFGPGDHATTFGGGPVVCAAALAVLEVISSEGLLDNAATMGERLADGLRRIVDRHDLAVGVRGRGLLQALELARPEAAQITEVALDNRLIVNAVALDAVRLAPPLTVTAAQIDDALSTLEAAVASVAAAEPASPIASPARADSATSSAGASSASGTSGSLPSPCSPAAKGSAHAGDAP